MTLFKMGKEEFLELLRRYNAGKTNAEEDRLILNYFESFQKNKDWPLELEHETELKQRMLNSILNNINNKKNGSGNSFKKDFAYPFLKYAAIIMVAFGLSFLYVSRDRAQPVSTIIEAQEGNSITLKLDNGAINVITENDSKRITDSKGNVVGIQSGNMLNYQKPNNESKELVYNELTVPLGKIFDLVLSDGTEVKLNSGSSIKYPVTFIKGKNREVEIWGEAFFDVTKDEDHPFIVKANDLGIEVLGTKFNVACYEEDNQITAVLVEGSVQLIENKNQVEIKNPHILKPNYKASLNKDNKRLSFEKVDTETYTAWINGRLIFRNSPFKNIRRKLERRYNVSIINNNKDLDEKLYNASFDIETIEQVLEAFKENYDIDFKIKGDQIIIN